MTDIADTCERVDTYPDFYNPHHRKEVCHNLANSGNGVVEDGVNLIEWYETNLTETQEELNHTETLLAKLAKLLDRAANALKGNPGKLKSHSWADLDQVAKRQHRAATTLLAAADNLLNPTESEPMDLQCQYENEMIRKETLRKAVEGCRKVFVDRKHEE